MEPSLPVIWLEDCTQQAVAQGRIRRALADQSIRVAELYEARDVASGIVLFDTVSKEALDLLRDRCRESRGRAIALCVGRAPHTASDAWALLAAGASDVLHADEKGVWVAQVQARFERWEEVDRLVGSSLVRENLVGSTACWIESIRQVVEVAAFTDSAVLIQGETGTGKELVARLIHTLDQRPTKGDLIIVDCANISPELAGSELFGHERGAFTGAVGTREGAFALADGGTLFLDEVGELPLPLQAQLLRAIQERTYRRVGGNAWQSASFRLVCATNRDLLEAVNTGTFRRDLYYRIASVICTLPPLRQRSADVIPLAQSFLRQGRTSDEVPELDAAVQSHLTSREYPGNVRDLRQLMLRILTRHVGAGPITIGDLPLDERPIRDAVPEPWDGELLEAAVRQALLSGARLQEIGRAATEAAIRIAVQEEGGSVRRAARRLGVTDRAIQLRRQTVRPVSPREDAEVERREDLSEAG